MHENGAVLQASNSVELVHGDLHYAECVLGEVELHCRSLDELASEHNETLSSQLGRAQSLVGLGPKSIVPSLQP